MAYANRILDYLWFIAPDGATNTQIGRAIGTTSHQTTYMLTQDLMRQGIIRGDQRERVWLFYAMEEPNTLLRGNSGRMQPADDRLSPLAFEALARRVLTNHYGTRLSPGSVGAVRKQFDLVSDDRRVVGDAKYYALVGGTRLPPAKFSIIAEHVWLLEKTGAPKAFLVFGNDRQVPALWLERYGNLASTVVFYFLTDDGRLVLLHDPNDPNLQRVGG